MKNKKAVKRVKRSNKKTFKFGIFGGIALLGGVTASVAAACASSNGLIFKFNSYTDVLQNNNSPLNPTFTYQPISTYAQSSMIGLVTYETSKGFKFNENGDSVETPKTTLKLEAATKVEGFDKSGKPTGTYYRNQAGLDETDQKFIDFQSKSVKYEFTIDTNIKWVDKNGVVQDSLSGKDFERGLETYILSSDLGYNRNGYFISLTGLDFDETVGYKDSKTGKNVSVDSPNYDVNNYKSTDDTFTLFLTSPYPYIFSILTKDYFNPLPHNNKYVQNIRVTDSNTPLAIDTDSKGKFLNQQNTNWNEIYGSGQVGTFLDHTWFAGPYYITKFSRNQIVGVLNNSYMESVGPFLDPTNGKKIKTFLMNYGSSNPEVDYENFSAGQISYLASVPNAKRSEAINKFLNNGLYVSAVVKISQSNYIAYTPKPYVFDSTGKVFVNNPANAVTISNDAAQMIYNWNSPESIIIRTGLSGLINHYQLSKLNISSGDFQYSNVPYGAFDISGLPDSYTSTVDPNFTKLSQYENYYKAIDDDALYGGLPRKVTDYHNGSFDINNLFTGSYGDFKVPFYSFSSDGSKVQEEQLDVNKNTFIDSLKAFGATTSQPFVLQYKYGQGSISDNYDNYLKALKRSIEALGTDSNGNKLLIFNLVNRQAPNPSLNDWYANQRSSLGFSYWSPDYNGVGTWLEANGTLDNNGLSSTNNHNIFNSLLRVLIMAAIDQNVSSIKVTDPSSASGSDLSSALPAAVTSSTFDNDPRIKAAFGETNAGSRYAKLGVEFLQYLVDNGVLNPAAINQLIVDPSILENQSKMQPVPKTENDLYPLLLDNNNKSKLKDKDGKDISIFNASDSNSKPNGSAELFNKYLGIWAGLSSENALWATVTMDNDYELLPLSEETLREKIYSLVDPHFFVRSSSVGSANIRDYEEL